MAAVEMSANLEDDEDWLYGDEKKPNVDELNDKIGKETAAEADKDAIEFESGDDGEGANKSADNSKTDAGNNAKDDADGADNDDDDDDEDDDDNVQVTIGDIRTWTGSETAPRNLFKSGQNYQKGSTISPAKPILPTKGLDIEAVGTINGTPVYDFDLNSLPTEEMPWRKPGADINDYFNYGFTEETWKAYCEKQKTMRAEASGGGAILPTPLVKAILSSATLAPQIEKPGLLPPPVSLSSLSSSISALNSIISSNIMNSNNISSNNIMNSNNISSNNISSNTLSNKNNNIITIGVIGGSSSRRKDDNQEQPIPVAGSFNRAIPVTYNQPPPSMPNTNLPPPGMPVHQQFGTAMPHFDSYFPSAVPGQAPQMFGGTFPSVFPPPFADPHPPPVASQPHWEPSFHGRERWDLNRPDHVRSTPNRDDDYDSRMFRERDRERERDWDREKDRDWEKNKEKSRDRDRSRERDRSRDKDRSRERDRDRSRDRNRSKDRDRDHDRDRDRNRDRERGRSRSKERDSSRNRDQERGRETTRTRDRDDKHKATRRKHRDDSDTESSRSSSKHKKGKRRKESKDEDAATPATTDEKPRE